MPDNILKLKDDFDIFLFDMYGVLWDGKKALAHALEAAELLKKEGKKVVVLSNSPLTGGRMKEIYSQREIVEGKHYDDVVTSGDVMRDLLLSNPTKLKYYQYKKPNKTIFEGMHHIEVDNPEEADFIYIGVPKILEDDRWTDRIGTDDFEDDLKYFLELDKVLMCANPDVLVFGSKFDYPVIREGAIALKYEEMGGSVEVIGKPYPIVYDYALKDYPDVDDSRVLMVGDTLETDILGGNSYGIKTALVEGGIASYNMKTEGFENIKDYAEEVGIIPDYFLKRV